MKPISGVQRTPLISGAPTPGNDTFNIDASVTGLLYGNDGHDTFNYISGVVSNVDGGTGMDSLVGANAAATWTFEANDPDTYDVGGDGVIELRFSNFETYIRGSEADTFTTTGW